MKGIALFYIIYEKHYDLIEGSNGKKKRKWTSWVELYRSKNYYEANDFLEKIVKQKRHLYWLKDELILDV
jgi:thiaminase